MDNVVYEEYSADRNYRFVVCKWGKLYKIWLENKVTDEYMGDEWFDYYPVADYMHIADTLERAVEIGKEGLHCFT